MKIPFVNTAAKINVHQARLTKAMQTVLQHGHYILGPEVQEFEKNFAAYIGVKYAVGVNSGTDALLLALKSLNLKQSDEVITAPNSFLASASVIALAGARIRFCDVGPDYNLDPKKLESCITENTRAIIPVHLTGYPAPMPEIMTLAQKHNIHVLEDVAQATGAMINTQKAGSFGDFGCFSFHPLKVLSALGDAGMVTTNSRKTYKRLCEMRNHGLVSRDKVNQWSINSRLDTIQAAVLDTKLPYLERALAKRRENAKLLQYLIKEPVVHPPVREHTIGSYQHYVIQAPKRDALQAHLADQGIGSAVHYPTPIHLQPACVNAGYTKGSLPICERQASQILSLPTYPALNPEDMRTIAATINAFYA